MRDFSFLITLLMLTLGGCAPTRYAWSPDAAHMTVLSDDGLRIADGTGHLLPPFIQGVRMAAWFSDSQRLAVVRDVPAVSWDQLEPALSDSQKQRVIKAAAHARDVAFEYEWDSPDAAEVKHFVAFVKQRAAETHQETEVYDELPIPIAIYFRDHRDDALSHTIPDAWWKQINGLTQPVHRIEMCRWSDGKAEPTPALMQTLQDVVQLRPSPDGRAVLIAMSAGEKDDDLWIASTDAKPSRALVSNNTAGYPDWSNDGQCVAFIAAADPASGQNGAGELCRARVAAGDAALAARVGSPEKLAAVRFNAATKLRCLRDGKIILSSPGGGAAVAAPGGSSRGGLLVWDPQSPRTVQPLLPAAVAEQVCARADDFEPNPSGTRISIPDDDGRVSVVDLASAVVRMPQDRSLRTAANQLALLTVPQWRDDDTLTVLAPGDNGQLAVELWSWATQKTVALSADWPRPLVPRP